MRFHHKVEDTISDWHDYFCWYPIVLKWTSFELQIVWLETIKRKKTLIQGFWFTDYKLPEDLSGFCPTT